jgi:maltose alpha-D-glucosyltransferase/alpha-amylase
MRKMIKTRKSHPTFGNGGMNWAEAGSEAIAAYWRFDSQHRILIVNNLSVENQTAEIDLRGRKQVSPIDLFTGEELKSVKFVASSNGNRLQIDLKPYQYLWVEV